MRSLTSVKSESFPLCCSFRAVMGQIESCSVWIMMLSMVLKRQIPISVGYLMALSSWKTVWERGCKPRGSPRLFSFLYPVCHLFIFPFLSLSIVPIYLPPAFFIPAIFLIAFFCTCRALYVNTRILKWILNLTGSQWRKVSVIWPLCPSIQLTES